MRAVTVRMEPDMIERIDEARGLVNREAWIRNVIEAHLADDPVIPEAAPVVLDRRAVVGSDQVVRRPPGQRKAK